MEEPINKNFPYLLLCLLLSNQARVQKQTWNKHSDFGLGNQQPHILMDFSDYETEDSWSLQ